MAWRVIKGSSRQFEAVRGNSRLTVGGLARERRVRSTPQTALSASTSCSVLQLVWAHSVPDEGGNQKSSEAIRGH